ncbi:hypothetical protein OKA04_14490 [Luteolibacter flavescens]|uniref:SH3 domain-containing protein n=1 Tax=Luteolibacter flavescens TaxID=1859460 RepID=A0ABT3FRM0_9BACT|nr:hypothetical protein [Luteolibacter flavescens]MCW1885944.1 hypothetical protein [Luteolibacter flavescens]
MKSNSLFIASALTLGGFALMGLQGQTPVSPGTSVANGDNPLGKKCVVSVDARAIREGRSGTEMTSSGFEADGTVKGELIRLSSEWCVLKNGTVENWIPTEKVLMIKVSE